tara:strand:- start:71 stop:574 length:504 start_codon:yes stop_codon:yes gene_type:complete
LFSFSVCLFDCVAHKQQQQLRTVASAWNAPVSEKNESGVILSDISARRARHVRFARLARALDSERDFPFFFCPVTPQNDSENGKCSFLIGGGRKATNALLFGTHHKRFVVVSFSSEEVRSLPDFSRGFKKRSSRPACVRSAATTTTRFFFLLLASVYPTLLNSNAKI